MSVDSFSKFVPMATDDILTKDTIASALSVASATLNASDKDGYRLAIDLYNKHNEKYSNGSNSMATEAIISTVADKLNHIIDYMGKYDVFNYVDNFVRFVTSDENFSLSAAYHSYVSNRSTRFSGMLNPPKNISTELFNSMAMANIIAEEFANDKDKLVKAASIINLSLLDIKVQVRVLDLKRSVAEEHAKIFTGDAQEDNNFLIMMVNRLGKLEDEQTSLFMLIRKSAEMI